MRDSLGVPARIALIADLREAVADDSRSELAAASYELVRAVHAWAAGTDMATVDLFARRGSWRGLPLVSIDPDELGVIPDGETMWDCAQEALYARLWASNMFGGYDLVHCLAPVVTPVHLLTMVGVPVVQTLVAPPTHPSCWLPPRLSPARLLRQVAQVADSDAPESVAVISAPVDPTRFTAVDHLGEGVLWDGTGSFAVAEAVAARLGRPLQRIGDDDAAVGMRRARVLLHLAAVPSPCGAPWVLRALACGVPVAGWCGGLDTVLPEPHDAALAPAGDVAALAEAIRASPTDDTAGRRRREAVLALHSPTGAVAQYRSLYQKVLRPGDEAGGVSR